MASGLLNRIQRGALEAVLYRLKYFLISPEVDRLGATRAQGRDEECTVITSSQRRMAGIKCENWKTTDIGGGRRMNASSRRELC
ncbi:hypothetical protein O181_049487 [Austropuccinia psidii MF-1]|uniref:Uncharacterized protein n=1 Tax=Austropuccinia psidii MF-1 TaxID=1389203 RepID=A0A9Q3HMN5_9BASI|nr:hypothetical protein [Austropuccinia psidii MF-1]